MPPATSSSGAIIGIARVARTSSVILKLTNKALRYKIGAIGFMVDHDERAASQTRFW